MKPFLFTLLLLASAGMFAQDSTWVEQYCRMETTGVPFTNKISIDIDFGEARRSLADYRLREETSGKLKKFNSVTDAMNYLGSQGWTLVNAFPVTANLSTYHYYFKKRFRKEELAPK